MWIARDKFGTLCAYSDKPVKYKDSGIWIGKDGSYKKVYSKVILERFKNVKWEDEEPVEIVR